MVLPPQNQQAEQTYFPKKAGDIPITNKIPNVDEFQKTDKDAIPKLVSSIAGGTKEEKQALLDLYTILDKTHSKLPESDPRRIPLGQKINILEKQMKEKNFSFIPKPPLKFATDNDRIEYLHNVLSLADTNEASAMEAFDIFEKYGNRYVHGVGGCWNSIIELSSTVSRIVDKSDDKVADKALSRYVDLFNKFADITPPDNNDTRFLGGI